MWSIFFIRPRIEIERLRFFCNFFCDVISWLWFVNMAPFHVQSRNKWTDLFISDGRSNSRHWITKRWVLIMGNQWCVVTCMIMIRLYIIEFSRRWTSCYWCIRNRMVGSTRRIQWRSPMESGMVIFTFYQISDFLRKFYTFLNFHSFSNGQKARKPRSATFSNIIVCKSRFFPTKKTKKNWFWALRRVSVAIVPYTDFSCKKECTQCFYENSWDESTFFTHLNISNTTMNWNCYQLKSGRHFSTNSIWTLNSFASLSYMAKRRYQQSISI